MRELTACVQGADEEGGGDRLSIVRGLLEGRKLAPDTLIEWRAPPVALLGTQSPRQQQSSILRRTLSMIASYHGCLDVLQLLLASGSNPNIQCVR